jgi:hypothetical protein
MNYPANTIDHEIGAQVIHDYDAKRTDMLMLVVGKYRGHATGETIYVTIYLKKVPKDASAESAKIQFWHNNREYLHVPSSIPNFGGPGQ